MEWELLYMCNLIGCIIICLIFIYHFIGAEEESKSPKSAAKAELRKEADVAAS